MGVPSKRFAVFLCLIVLHQDLVIARSHYDLDLAVSSRLRNPADDDIGGDYLPSNQTISSNELTVSSSRALGREKRLFGLILFIVSIVVTVVATTVETIYDIHGCCGLGFNYLCSFEANFKRKQDRIQERARDVDRRLQEAVKKKDNLECLSKVLEGFWTEIKRLVTLQQEFFEAVAPGLLDSLIRKESRIGNVIRDTRGGLDQTHLENFENKIEEGQLAIKLSLGWSAAALPGFARLGRHAWKAFKFNRLYKTLKATQLETLLKATPKAKELVGFTGGSAKVFIKGIAKTRFASKAALASKGMKIVKFGGWFMSVLSIAIDIFSTVSILMGCDNKVDEAEKAMSSLDEPERNVTAMEKTIGEYEKQIKTEMVDKILPELRTGELHSALKQVKETIDNLPTGQRTWLTRDCVESIIPDALKTFKRSNDYIVLKDELKYVIENCVSPLKYAYECLTSRVNVMTKIADRCRAGNGEFDDIYEQVLREEGTKKDECIKEGEPYSLKKDYRKSLEELSKNEEFPIPCRLSSEAFKTDVCGRKSYQSPQKIARDVNMDVIHIRKILEKCQHKDEFNQVQKNRVCQMRALCDEPKDIKDDFEFEYDTNISIEQIKNMPCPEKKKNPECASLYE